MAVPRLGSSPSSVGESSRLAIKVDVDTLVGTKEGLPRLAEIFKARNIRASFFLSLGPDNSGRAVFRVLTRPGFLTKMIRTRVPSTYGLKTMLYGTLLPAPIIGRGRDELFRSLREDGHELGLHAWDHVTWHDRLWKMSPDQVRAEVARGVAAFEQALGEKPLGFAAPAWRINAEALTALQDSGFRYTAATRGRTPFRPYIEGRQMDLLEIPTTLPTADEILGRDGVTPGNLADCFFRKIIRPGFHVLTIHAEMEGRGLSGVFAQLLDKCQEGGVKVVRLIDAAEDLLANPETIPASPVVRMEVAGRAGEVSLQE